MNKQGLLWGTIIIWLVVIAFVIIVIMAYYIGPDSFVVKIARNIPGVDHFLPKSNENPSVPGVRGETDDARVIFDEFVSAFTHLASDDSQACFAYIPARQMETLFTTFDIQILNSGNGMLISLIRKIDEGDPTQAISGVYVSEIPDMKPCVVFDTAALSFYDNWLDETPSIPSSPDIRNVNTILLSEKKIKFDTFEEDWETFMGGEYAVYKYDNNICLFPVKKLGIMRTKMCQVKDGTIATNCFNTHASDDDAFYKKPLIASHSWDDSQGMCKGALQFREG